MTEDYEQEASLLSKLSIAEIYYLVFRHKWLLILGLVVGLGAAAAVYLLTPSFFRSEAKLLVRYIEETAPLDPETTGGRVISTLPRGANVISTEVEILTSRALAEQVARDVGIPRIVNAPMPGPRQDVEDLLTRLRARVSGVSVEQIEAAKTEQNPLSLQAVGDILRGLEIDVPSRSNIIRLYFRGPSPALAQDVLSSLVNQYLRRHVEVHRSGKSFEFLSQQTDQLKARLAETEDQLRRLKAEAGIVAIGDAKTAVSTEVRELTRALEEAETGLAVSQARIDVLRASAPESSRAEVPVLSREGQQNVVLVEAYDKLRRLRERENGLLSSFTEDSLPLKDIRRQIEEVQEVIASESAKMPGTNTISMTPSSPSVALVSEFANAAALEARIGILKKRLAVAEEHAQRVEAVENRIVQLERKKELDEANYRYFSRKLEQSRIDDALDSGKISNISIVQPATLPTRMFRPRLRKNMFTALFLGLMLGIGLTVVREYFVDRSLRKPQQLETALHAPLLISIPAVSSAGRFLTGRRQSSVKLLPAHPGAGQATDREAKGRDRPSSAGWNLDNDLRGYFEALRDRLLGTIAAAGGGPHLLGITSCLKGSGVTTTAGGLGVTLARNGDGRVLLVDAAELDFASAGQLLGSGSSAGLMDIMTDKEGHTRIVQPNLYILSAAEVSEDVPRMSLAQGLENLLKFARESKYAFVIFDLPPVDETSLALRLARHMDSVMLIIEAEKVPREQARQAQDLLAKSKANLIGTILNKRRTYVPEWLHKEI